MRKKGSPTRRKERLPKIEETEFAADRLISKAIQRSYRQSGIAEETMTKEDE